MTEPGNAVCKSRGFVIMRHHRHIYLVSNRKPTAILFKKEVSAYVDSSRRLCLFFTQSVNNIIAIVNSTAEYHQFPDRRRTNVRFKGGLIGYNAKMTTEYVDPDTDVPGVGGHDRKLTQNGRCCGLPQSFTPRCWTGPTLTCHRNA